MTQLRKHFGTAKPESVIISTPNLVSFSALADADYPIPGSIWGIDISHWTGIVPDWSVVKASGCRFVIIKAMHGKNIANCFKENYTGAVAAGLPVSHYQWLCPAKMVSPADQAKAYAELCREYPPTMYDVWTDFEYTPFAYKEDGHSRTVTTELSDLDSFLRQWNSLLTFPIGIYSSPSYWREHGSAGEEWLFYELWLANYETDRPDVPAPFEEELFWQFSENGDGDMIGTAPGERRVDLNYFNGTEADWEDYFGTSPNPPPTGEPMLIAHNPSELYLRNAPRVAPETVITKMPANTHIEGTEIVTAADGGKWLHTTIPQPGYCASWLLEYETTPPPPGATLPIIHQTAEGYPDNEWKPL